MTEGSSLTIGLIATISPELNDTWGAEARERGLDRLRQARQVLESLGAAVIDPSEITTTNESAARHGRLLRQQGAHILVVYVAMWSYGSAAVSAAAECGVPVVVGTDTDVQYVGIVGATVVRGSLDEAGIKNTMVYGEVDDPVVRRKLEVACVGGASATRLRGLQYGLMGSRSLGMLTASVDANFWRRRFGVEVEAWDQLEVVERARSLPGSAVAHHVAWTKDVFGDISVSEEVLSAGIKLYVICKRIIEERGFDFVSVRCLPEMPGTFTTFCYAIALLNDTNDADGDKEAVVCACESDSNGALTMQILKHLAGAPVLFADVRHVDLADRQIWLSNCGSSATQLASSRSEIRWVNHGFNEYTWKLGAATPQYVCKGGRVTLARLTRVAGEYVMLIAGGRCIEEPREKLAKTHWEFSPHAFVEVDGDARQVAEELRSNHLHMVYGDYVSHLVEACRVLEIRPIVVD